MKLFRPSIAVLGVASLIAGCTATGSDDAISANPASEDPAADVSEAQITVEEDMTPPRPPEKVSADSSLAAIWDFIQTSGVDTSKDGWRTKLPKPPEQPFSDDKTYSWNLETSEGPIVIKLMPDVAPMHVTSTIYLTELGFYDGISFHRVIPGFMAQGGCPLGTGTGGPGYKYSGEFSPAARHDRPGLLSMANAGPNTDGSQFFLTFVPTPHLDDKHTIFGEVVEGMDNLQKLEAAGSGNGRPSRALSIRKATITIE